MFMKSMNRLDMLEGSYGDFLNRIFHPIFRLHRIEIIGIILLGTIANLGTNMRQ